MRRWVPLVAAAAVLLAIGLAAAIVAGLGGVVEAGARPQLEAVGPGDPARSESAAASPEELVVRDGVTVEASGTVLARNGEPVWFCAPAMETADLRPGDADGPRCSRPVTVVGVDLDRLSEPGSGAVGRFGRARLRGTWKAGTLTVTDQGPPVVRPSVYATAPMQPPCPPPDGGWRNGTGYPNSRAVHDYLYQEHPDQFRPPYMTYPNGIPNGPSPPGDAATVMVIEVVQGDVDMARDQLGRRYDGNLCVVSRPGLPSIADQKRQQVELRPAIEGLMRDQSSGIFAIGYTDLFVVELIMLTPELYERFRSLGLEKFQFEPWLRPVTA